MSGLRKISKKELKLIIAGLNVDLSGAGLSGVDLSGADLSGADLSGADLSEASLIGADLIGADLSGANLSGANLSGANLSGANLSGANLIEAYLVEAHLIEAHLSRAHLSGAHLNEAKLSGADLSGANLNEAKLSGANLSEADLRRADLSGADLSGAKLSGADLSEANLSEANLSGANLSGADLIGAKLSGAVLNGAKLSGANLHRANLHRTNLIDANLIDANLSGAKLIGANLSGADLSEAKLIEVNLIDADLYKTKFNSAQLIESTIIRAKCLEIGSWDDANVSGAIIDESFRSIIPKDLYNKYKNTINVIDSIPQTSNRSSRVYVEISNNNEPDETIIKTHINYFTQYLIDFHKIEASLDITTHDDKFVVEIYPKDTSDLNVILVAFVQYLLCSIKDTTIILNDNIDLKMEFEDLQDEMEDYKAKQAKLLRRIKTQQRELGYLDGQMDKAQDAIERKNKHLRTAKKCIEIFDRLVTIQAIEKNQPVNQNAKLNIGPGMSLKARLKKIKDSFEFDFEFSSNFLSIEHNKTIDKG